MTGRNPDGRDEFARRLRVYMGYADRTLEDVAQSLQSLGVSVSASTINRWTRGLSVPDIMAAQALGQLAEDAGLAGPGEGVTWLLGKRPAGPLAYATEASPDLDRVVGSWQFHSASPALSRALAERGVPAAYRRPLADLLAQLLAEVEADGVEPPLADGDATS